MVTGISALGYDHIAVLGKTIEEIAWQKSGIFKVILFTYNYEQILSTISEWSTRNNGGATS